MVGNVLLVSQFALRIRLRWNKRRNQYQQFNQEISNSSMCSHRPNCLSLDRYTERETRKSGHLAKLLGPETDSLRRLLALDETIEHYSSQNGPRGACLKWIRRKAPTENRDIPRRIWQQQYIAVSTKRRWGQHHIERQRKHQWAWDASSKPCRKLDQLARVAVQQLRAISL